MKPAPFVHHVPKTLDEALQTLAEVAPKDGRVLAGGQSLVPIMAFRLAKPAHLVDINGVAGLDKLACDEKTLSIGACVRHAAFHKAVVANPLGQLLTVVARHIAHYPIRTRGTFCGSLAHADPSSEWCLVAATLDATLVARSVRGARTIAAGDFFAGIMSTTLADDELLAVSEAIDRELERRQEQEDPIPESARLRAIKRSQSYRHNTGASALPVRVAGLRDKQRQRRRAA